MVERMGSLNRFEGYLKTMLDEAGGPLLSIRVLAPDEHNPPRRSQENEFVLIIKACLPERRAAPEPGKPQAS